MILHPGKQYWLSLTRLVFFYYKGLASKVEQNGDDNLFATNEPLEHEVPILFLVSTYSSNVSIPVQNIYKRKG